MQMSTATAVPGEPAKLVPKEQPPRKLSGHRTDTAAEKTLESDAACIRRRDNDLRRKDRGGIARKNPLAQT